MPWSRGLRRSRRVTVRGGRPAARSGAHPGWCSQGCAERGVARSRPSSDHDRHPNRRVDELVLLDWMGGRDSRSASDRLILAGVLAAGATFATGWSDWADAEQRSAAVRRSGLAHAAVNGTATWLMIGSYVAR